ncbi:MAG: hypothetical protein NWR72_02070, partial [Bacteroidia bacterium]|nr:hypothetical protein [Bacteroidia bacterium]
EITQDTSTLENEAILDQQEGYVHAVVGSVENIQVGVAKLGSGSGESASLRLAAEAAMALSYGQPISISKPGESVVPVGKWANEAPAPWISLSHHEGWGGFAFVACG